LRPRTLLPVRRALPPELSPLSLHDALPISLTVTTTGTSFTLSGAPTGFSLEAGNVIHSGGKFRRVASVLTSSTGTLDAAFPADLAGAACMVAQALWTKNLVTFGDASQKTRLADIFPSTDVPIVHL